MKPLEVGSFEAKNRLSELVSLAEKGQRIYITRRGKRVAMLVSPDMNAQRNLVGESLVSAMREFRSRAGRGPESLREMIAEGRR